jgi:hypothetical protein
MTTKITEVNGVTITEHFGAAGKAKEAEVKADGFQTRLEQIKSQKEKSNDCRTNHHQFDDPTNY